MTLFDSIQNMVFGKKKSKDDIVENDALGKVTPVAASTKAETTEIIEKQGEDFSIEDLRNAINLQRQQIEKIKDSVKSYDKHIAEYDKAKKVLSGSRQQLEKQKKEYVQVANRSDITAQQKDQFRKVLRDIDKALSEIKENEKNNEKFVTDVRYAIKESEKAVRVNQKALDQNEQALKAASESKGDVRLQSKDIGDLEKQVEAEDLVSIPKEEMKTSSSVISTASMPPTAQGTSKMKDDDYWEKGNIS